jgi:hypothetical protein
MYSEQQLKNRRESSLKMKKNKLMLTVTALVLGALRVFGQSLIPVVETGPVDIKFTGFERNVYDSSAAGQKFDWTVFRVNAGLTLKSDPRWTMFTQVDFKNIDNNGGNYLRLCYIQFAPSTNWLVRAGRNFSAAPYYTTPMLQNLETVKYPREPWGYYNYGIQTEGRLGNGWSLIADVSGASGRSFQTENFDHAEVSWRIAKRLGKIELGQVTQLSPDFIRAGMSMKYCLAKSLTITGEYYHQAQRGAVDVDGGYALINWYPAKLLGVHLQLDEQFKGGDSSTITTAGVLLRTPKDNIHVILDFQNDFCKEVKTFLACLQFRF